jgi:CheY-like chemotaxis protein/HPt (histidine-containing phosphotransfer) domain-containing protein
VRIAAGTAYQARGLHAQLDARILLVEDNPVNQELALHMLEHLGCRASVARHGREALAALDGEAFDAVLMDCQMPEMDGYEATAAIRIREAAQGPETRRTPIIALTAGAVEGDRDKCLAAGMDDYLSKPFSLEQLERTLRRWLPSVPSIEPGEPHVDPKVIESMLVLGGGGRDLLCRLIDLFLQDAPQRVLAIQEALERGDAQAVARAAHAFKSASANLGASALAQLCSRLEMDCREGSLTAAEGLVAEIEAEYAYVSADLAGRVRETAA